MSGRIWAPSYDGQSYACAYIEKQRNELRRLRISQLRRMADRADMLATTAEMPYYARFEKTRIAERLRRFTAACLAEIERLRGEG